MVMIYLSQEEVGTVPHIHNGPHAPDQAVHDSPTFAVFSCTTNQGFDRTIPDLPCSTRRKRPSVHAGQES